MSHAFALHLLNAPPGTLAAAAPEPGSPAAAGIPDGMGWFMPPAGSTFADEVDWAMNFINGVTIFFFVLIVVLMVWFALRDRRRDPRQRALAQTTHNTPLEIGWSVPPLVIVLYMFWLGFSGFMTLTTIPEDAYLVEVEARSWSWQFIHPNGRVDTHLHVPAGEPVRLRMNSTDVLHSAFIPAFRTQQDVVPGRYSWLWFEATAPTPGAGEPLPEGEALDEMIRDRVTDRVRARLEAEEVDVGPANPSPSPALEEAVAEELEDMSPDAKRNTAMEMVMELAEPRGHILYCAEYCGTLHSQMNARVVVHEPGWRPPPPDLPPVGPPRGRHYFHKTLGCAACHQTGPERLPSHIGPAFTGRIYGTISPQLDDPNQVVDDNFLRRAILNPQAQVKVGYPPAMPPLAVSEEELRDVIAYLRSIEGEVPTGYQAQ